jgi:hypothetical protein
MSQIGPAESPHSNNPTHARSHPPTSMDGSVYGLYAGLKRRSKMPILWKNVSSREIRWPSVRP